MSSNCRFGSVFISEGVAAYAFWGSNGLPPLMVTWTEATEAGVAATQTLPVNGS